ncbi:MAG TPA: MSMEG_0567/sll0787 family protein [Pseudonocardiaceae bacterium]
MRRAAGGRRMTAVWGAGADLRTDTSVLLGGPRLPVAEPAFRIEEATDADRLAAYRALRVRSFVTEQGMFARDDTDEHDGDPRTVALVALDGNGTVIGGVRLGPAGHGDDVGWWYGGRLVVDRTSPGSRGAGAALVRAACARAEQAGVLRFEATVQARYHGLFERLGWLVVRAETVRGRPHLLVRWPIDRIERLVAATKRELGPLLRGLAPGGAGFVGDDAAPVPGSDLVAACDAILPAMVARDPEWAGWCSVLVNVNDIAAMGAVPVGLLDAVAARDASFAARILRGLRAAAQAYRVPILGGHTQFGVPAALSVTALGRTDRPVPGGGGRPGDPVALTMDTGGGWRPGYRGRQWDSTSHRSGAELRAMIESVGTARPAAAKDVSMAGVVGTLGMLAEACGCGAVLDVACVPRPAGVAMGDWLTCFPGFGMITAGGTALPAGPAVGAECGVLVPGAGVRLRWPDGTETEALTAGVTGMGPA